MTRARLPLLLAALLLPAAALAQTSAGVISERQAGLRGMQQHLEATEAVVQRRQDPGTVAPRAEAMAAFFSNLPALFPPGSEGPGSRALPTVWSDRAGFEGRAAAAARAAENLRRVSAAGDAAGLEPAFREMAGTCGACHRAHRGR